MKRLIHFFLMLGSIVLAPLLILFHQPAVAASPAEAFGSINDAAVKLVQFCIDPKVGLDEQAVATLVDFVLTSKQNREYALPSSMDCTGAYFEFDTKTTFPRFLEYSYNPFIPAVITRPSSVRYSFWTVPRGKAHELPGTWKPIPPAGIPVVIHGIQRESDTPDLTTAVYHEYDLKRTLILLNHKGQQVLVSVSKQISKSNVGKKGVILGNDNDWNYYYSGEPGTPKTGLGWVKSYIYDCFSVGVYVESSTAPTMLRAGVFHWLRAGWSGINFVKSNHILNGMKRFARDCRMILESPRLPAPNQMVSVYQGLLNMPAGDLIKKYLAFQQGQLSSAIQIGRIKKPAGEERPSLANTPKEQMVEELMLEYLKVTLEKPTPSGN
jgi:hypothetical protein